MYNCVFLCHPFKCNFFVLTLWEDKQGVPLLESLFVSYDREIKDSLFGKNGKLVEQIPTGTFGKTLTLYSTAHLISDNDIINTKDLMVPLSVTVVTNPDHEEDLNNVCSS